ncbi:hypothetical protein AVEN_263162-1 [Araneus ventricosus]|uniref:Uncharacterized protein n=1 Tax=Araneus ventricosus TaxID=182803 RepID=A0A4Y2F8D7_ARAVE|nr:hypothetical protein AVEN_263162-1 [Araneus ventricosus]
MCVHSRSNGREFQTKTLRDDAIWEGFVGPFLQPLSPSDLGGPVTFSVGKFAGAFQDLTILCILVGTLNKSLNTSMLTTHRVCTVVALRY